MPKLIFYTKSNCHLCEEADQILSEIASDIPLEIEVVDIIHADDKDIIAKYADRIPVIARPDLETELNWPFTFDDVRTYLVR